MTFQVFDARFRIARWRDEGVVVRWRRSLTTAAAVAGACTISGLLTGFVPADADTVNAAAAVAAIQQVAPKAVTEVAPTADASDVAVATTIEGQQVVVPFDPAEGISVGGNVQIGLPFAHQASDAAQSPTRGVVAFDNNNGSTTVPVIHQDGSVQISTVIENADAPKRYDYPIHVPEGASLTQSTEGVVAVVTADGAPLTVFGEAWAKDANGDPVVTHYEVSGNTLTQVVETNENTAYPVVADPQTTGVYSYNCVLQNGSTPANPQAFGTPECYIAIGVGLGSVYGPGWLVRFLSGAIGYVFTQGLPSITACRG